MPEVGNISARVSLDTAEFRQGIKQMSQQMAIAREEFKQATSGLDRVENAMEIAKAKAKMLEQQIELQSKTVEQLNEQWEKAVEMYGENSRQATEYRLRLERARTSLIGMRTDLSRTNQEMEDLNNSTNDSSDGLGNLGDASEGSTGKLSSLASMAGTAALSLAAVGVAAVTGLVVKGVTSANDMQKAVNSLQAQTGLLNDEETKFSEIMKDMYASNFGENFDDLGKSIAEVNKQTGLMGDELQNLTEDALLLRDTFEFEVNESVRAADMMMKTFGDTGDEAYNLIALGAQRGLDKNQNLLDSINEYSIHFKQIGLDSEDMFNMFTNGANAGVFDIDKLGDAVKEFGIRVKDGSSTSMQAFTDLGLNAQQLTKDFNEGGEKGKAAFELVTSKINAMQDPVKQNQIGVALFGTMWEDMGSKAVAALTSNEKSINKNIDALKQINDVKYDTFDEALKGIGRQLETEIVIPIGEKVLPKLEELSKWIQSNMPSIQAQIKTAVDSAFVVFDKLKNVIKGVIDNFDLLLPVVIGVSAAITAQLMLTKVVALYGAWKTATAGVTVAQWALNVAMDANPIGLVALAIGELVTAVGILYTHWDEAIKIFNETPTALKLIVGGFVALNPILAPITALVLGITGAIKGVQYAMSDSVKAADLFGEGVSKGTKKAVSGYIKLSEDAEKELLKLKTSGEAISDSTSKTLTEKFISMADQIKVGMDKKFKETLEIMQGFFSKSSSLTTIEETIAMDKLKGQHEKEKKEVEDNAKLIEIILKNASDMNRKTTEDENNTISELKKNMNKIAIENLSKTEIESKTILERMRLDSGNITTLQSADIIKNSLKTKDESIKNAEEKYSREIGQIIRLRDESKTITKEQADKLIADAERQKNESVKKAEEMHDKIVSEAKKQSKEHVNEVDWETGEIKSKWTVFWDDLGDSWDKNWENAKKSWKQFWGEVGDSITNFGDNTKEQWSKEWGAVSDIISSAWEPMKKSWNQFWGEVADSIVNFGPNLKTKWNTEWDIVSSSISTAFSDAVETFRKHGKNIIEGLWDGISSKITYVKNKISEFADSIPKSVKKILDIKSPSRVMAEIGKNVAEGLAKGMSDNVKLAKSAADELANATISRLNKLGGAIQDALKTKYNSQMESEINPLQELIDKTNEGIYFNEENDSYISFYQKKIDKINETIAAEEKAAEDKSYLDALKEKQDELLGIKDTRAEQEKIQDEIKAMELAHEKERTDELRQKELDRYQEAIDNQKKYLESARKDAIDDYQKQIDDIKTKYAKMSETEATEAEARRLAIANDQDAIITLLETYNPKWLNAGQTFAEQLLNGLNSEKTNITNTVNEIMGMMNNTKNASNAIILQAKNLWQTAKNEGNTDMMAEAHKIAEDARKNGGTIPAYATGVTNFRGGLARINESGGEIVNLPIGANIIPNDISKQIANSIGSALGGNSNTVNVYVTLDSKELVNTISEVQQSDQISTSRRNGVTVWR